MPRIDQCLRVPRSQNGFTYLWLLLVVMLFGVSLSIGADVYTTSLQREKERELLAIGAQFRAAIASYRALGVASGRISLVTSYPASLDELLLDRRVPGVRRHLRKLFVDPMTGGTEWGLVKVGDRIVGVHSLSTKPSIQRANFEPDDATLTGSDKLSDWWFTWPPDVRSRINGAGDPNLGAPPLIPQQLPTTPATPRP